MLQKTLNARRGRTIALPALSGATGIAVAVIVFYLGAAGLSSADLFQRNPEPIPADATPPVPEDLFYMFAGHSENWSEGGGVYYAPDGTWIAVSANSVGSGMWYVTTSSRLCTEGTWSWRQDFGIVENSSDRCRRFMTDASGEMWTSSRVSGPWYPFNPGQLSAGNAFASRYRAISDMLEAAR